MNAHEPTRDSQLGSLDDQRPIVHRPLTTTAPDYETTTTSIAPGGTLPIADDQWVGALIVVTSGSIQLECLSGATQTFPVGSIVWFSGLGLLAAYNNNTAPATIVSIRRVTPHHGRLMMPALSRPEGFSPTPPA